MHAISVSLGITAWRLLFKTEEKAKENFNKIAGGVGQDKTTQFSAPHVIDITDDFGQRAIFTIDKMNGCMFEDLDQAMLGSVEIMLINDRANANHQVRAQADPTLRTARMVRQPQMIQPMNGGFNG